MAWSKEHSTTVEILNVGKALLTIREHVGGKRYFTFNGANFAINRGKALRCAETLRVFSGTHSDYGYPVEVYTVLPNPHRKSVED